MHITNPLCFTALEANSTVYLTTSAAILFYSTDNDSWNEWRGETLTLQNIGDKLYFYGENESLFDPNTATITNFGMTGMIAASGDVTTLLNPNGVQTLTALGCFLGLFEDCSSLETAPELPATTLSRNCYEAMFRGCTNLKSSPILPATTLAENCYWEIFAGCENLCEVTVEGNITRNEAEGWLHNVNIQEAGIIYSRENLNTSLIPRGFAVIRSKDTFNYTYDNWNGRAVYAFNGNFPYTDTLVGAIYVEEDESSKILIYCSQNGLHLDSSEWNTQYGTIEDVIIQFDNRQMFISVRIFEGYHMRVDGGYSERTPEPTITGTDNTTQCSDGSTIHTGTGTVTITDPSPEALIKYSINNGEWIDYSTPIQLSTGEYTIKSYATQSGYNASRTVTYQITVSEEEECQPKPVRLRIVDKLVHILEDMVADTASDLASFQYNSIAKGNVRLDAKMANPTALLVQITDWSLDLTNMTKREAVEVSLFFLDKETKIDNEALAQEVIIKNMADIACDFLARLMTDKSLRIVDENVKIKSVFYQSDSNRDGVCLQMRIEERGGSCL